MYLIDLQDYNAMEFRHALQIYSFTHTYLQICILTQYCKKQKRLHFPDSVVF